MPGAGLLAVLDDIATVLDDVAILTKVAAKKTAGVLGDDLALNAQQVTGVRANRELPVVWAVAKGSLLNKVILVPAALAISAFVPWAVTPLLMVGGAYLCFEGCEKLAHKFLHSPAEDRQSHAKLLAAVADPDVDLVAIEKEKIKGAVRTDFILSAEIVTISLGTVAEETLVTRFSVLTTIALLMTIGVYGFVAAIVKLDDLGLRLIEQGTGGVAQGGFSARAKRGVGAAILKAAPWLMKLLSVAGTVAMFLVGGGILTHGIPGFHDWVHHWVEGVARVPTLGGVLAVVVPTLIDAVVGIAAGAVILLAVHAAKRAMKRH